MRNPLEIQDAGRRISSTAVLLLGLAVLPHINHLHYSILLSFGLMAALKLLANWKYPVLGNRWIILLAAVLFFSNSAWHYGIPIGRDPGVSFLVVLLGLKLLESKSRRDTRIVLILGYFVVVTHFLFFVSAPVVLFLFVIVMGLTWQMVQLEHVEPDNFYRSDILLTGKMITQAIPFAIILFFLFPRFAGSLWLLQSPSDSSVTGMSDTLSMGSIANLVESEEIAFTATFEDGNIPPSWARYWRGGVLWSTDGRNWTRGARLNPAPGRPFVAGISYRYEIDIPNSGNQWMYVLDNPTEVPGQSRLSADFVLSGLAAGKALARYSAVSSIQYRSKIITRAQLEMGTALPPGIVTSRIEQFVDRQRELLGPGATDAIQFSNAILRHFNENEFTYTLRPRPLLSSNPVDEFLFESRQGFCEYYASSFVTLMRAAGFPARIVIGYLGGEYNPRANQLTIRQSDAHAWTEYWSETEGWVRADPTAAIAPERIQNSINYDLSMAADGNVLYMPLQLDFLEGLLREARWYSALAKQQWNRWFVGFDSKRQQILLESLGMENVSIQAVAGIAFLVSVVVLVALAFWFFRRDVNEINKTVRLYAIFCEKMSKRGITREIWEGPEDFRARCVRKFPQLEPEIGKITRLYTSMRYQGKSDNEGLRALETTIIAFKPV